MAPDLATMLPVASLRISVPRHVPAPPEAVFDAWADPARFRQWFEAHRAILQPAAVDALWFWEAEHQGRIWPHYCRWVGVERPHRLEFTWMSEGTRGLESRVSLEMTPAGGGTDLVLTHDGLPDDEIARGHEPGWKAILDGLAGKIAQVR